LTAAAAGLHAGRALRSLAVAALGALQTLAFVHTTAWWLPLLGAAVLAALVWRATPSRAAWLGWLYGSAWLGAGTWWLFISLHHYGGLPAWMAVLAVALLCMGLSLYLALAMAVFARLRSGRAAVDAALFAHAEERELAEATEAFGQRLAALLPERRVAEAFAAMEPLADVLERFFVAVLVMCEDGRVRSNRIALLKNLGRLFMQLADLSRLQVEGGEQ